MKIGGIINNDLANGEGVRLSIFVSGCPHRCKNCHNPDLWDYGVGADYDDSIIEKIIEELKRDGVHRGLSILGGEPLAIPNRQPVLDLIKKIKVKIPDLNIWLWTGYKKAEIEKDDIVKMILNEIDVLIDGRYEEDLRGGDHPWRGSANQKLYRLKG